jgi:hypothetical protein
MKHQILTGLRPLNNAQRLILYRRRLDAWKLNQWHKSISTDRSWLPRPIPHTLIRQAH